jgi:hypothetical protein
MRTLVLLAVIMASPAIGQTCPSPAGWAKPVRHLAARTPTLKFALATGTSNEIGLLPARDVQLAVRSGRAAKADTTAGLAALDVQQAGTLDVIVSAPVYVDLVRDGQVLKSTGHADLKTCPGLRKSVSFTVVPARYIVQLSDGRAKSVRLATVLH